MAAGVAYPAQGLRIVAWLAAVIGAVILLGVEQPVRPDLFWPFHLIESRLKPDAVQQFRRSVKQGKRNADPRLSVDVGSAGF
jgi:hypothetical protein